MATILGLTMDGALVKEGFASFYYDLTAGTSRAQLGAIFELVPVTKLLMGLDYPYMPEWSFESVMTIFYLKMTRQWLAQLP